MNALAPYSALARTLFVLALSFAVPTATLAASHPHNGSGSPWTGSSGVSETVSQIMARESHHPPKQLKEKEKHTHSDEEDKAPPNSTNSPAVAHWPISSGSGLGASEESPQIVGTSFLGAQLSEAPFIPPDSMGAVGPSQVVVIVNGRVKVFSKNGTPGPVDTSTDNFFSSVRGSFSTSDPHVRYDRLSGRWFIVMINISCTKNRVLLAVSSGPTITSTSSFTFYQFVEDFDGGDANLFADYPTLGVDALALYIGVNMFSTCNGGIQGKTAFVVSKASVTNGGPIVVTAFRGLNDDGAGSGMKTPQGVDNDDPIATEGYIIGTDIFTSGKLDIRRISNPGGTPSISGTLAVIVPTTGFPIAQAHRMDTLGKKLDALDDRLFAAALHLDKIGNTRTLWTAHNMEVDTNGVALSGGGRNGSRWYQIGNLTSAPTLIQSGTLFDPAAANPRGFWIPSVAMSGQGHMALGCSYAGTNDQAGVATAGRLRTDSLGTIQPATLAVKSTFGYNLLETTAVHRWGDFSQVVVDPADDMTMWTFQEYTSSTSSWGVRVVQLRAPPPATPFTVFPTNILEGQTNVDLQITGTSASGSEFFDPGSDPGGPGYTNHIAASVNGGGVAINSVTFTGPTNLTINVSVLPGVTGGSRTITITNPDGQSRTSVTSILNVIALPAIVFTASTTNGSPPLTVNFTNLTTGSTNYSWDLGNGDYSTAVNPSTVYTNPGRYSVSLAASGVGGTSSLTKTNFISVVPPPFITAPTLAGTNLSFSFATLAGFSYVVQFKNTLADAAWQNGQIVSGDGNIQTVFIPTTSPAQRFFRLQVQ